MKKLTKLTPKELSLQEIERYSTGTYTPYMTLNKFEDSSRSNL